MPRKPTGTKSGKAAPREENLHDEAAFEDLLVSDEALAKHTAHAEKSSTRKQLRKALSKVKGSLVDEVRQQRDNG